MWTTTLCHLSFTYARVIIINSIGRARTLQRDVHDNTQLSRRRAARPRVSRALYLLGRSLCRSRPRLLPASRVRACECGLFFIFVFVFFLFLPVWRLWYTTAGETARVVAATESHSSGNDGFALNRRFIVLLQTLRDRFYYYLKKNFFF